MKAHDESDDCLGAALIDLAWACATLDHIDMAFLQQFMVWFSGCSPQRLNNAQLLRLFELQCCLRDAAVQHAELRMLALPMPLLAAATRAWQCELQGHKQLTPLHKEVHTALQLAGMRGVRLHVTLDGSLVVDFMLQGSPSSRLKAALQLEGPERFASNAPHAPLGPTAARWRALRARGWKVGIVQPVCLHSLVASSCTSAHPAPACGRLLGQFCVLYSLCRCLFLLWNGRQIVASPIIAGVKSTCH